MQQYKVLAEHDIMELLDHDVKQFATSKGRRVGCCCGQRMGFARATILKTIWGLIVLNEKSDASMSVCGWAD